MLLYNNIVVKLNIISLFSLFRYHVSSISTMGNVPLCLQAAGVCSCYSKLALYFLCVVLFCLLHFK